MRKNLKRKRKSVGRRKKRKTREGREKKKEKEKRKKRNHLLNCLGFLIFDLKGGLVGLGGGHNSKTILFEERERDNGDECDLRVSLLHLT